MYEKLHRWIEGDEGVELADIADREESEPVEPDTEESFVIDYKRRITPEDEY